MATDIQTIAVITSDLDNFIKWKQSNFNESELRGLNVSTKFQTNKAKYIGIVSERQLCGYMIDTVIQLEDAKLNPNYNKIIEELKYHLKKNLK